MTSQAANVETAKSHRKGLYMVGGTAALIMVVLIPIQSFIFIAYPPPGTVNGYFTLFQHNWLLGLLDLDLLYIVDNILLVPIYLALYTALKRSSEFSTLIALTLGLLGVAAYFASNTAFEMLSLSRQYAAAATDAQRAMFLAAGQSMLATYSGTAFDMYYVLNAAALLIFSGAMLRTNVFSRTAAYIGLLAGIFMIVPSTAGTIGLYFSLGSLIPWFIWLILFAGRLFQLGRLESRGAMKLSEIK